MDFVAGAGGMRVYPSNIPLPFYMTYPGYFRQEQESAMIQDLEYLQNSYPGEVRKLSKRVAEILDKVDFEGSMIYDEYPDKYSICRLAHTICEILQREESREGTVEGTEDTERREWEERLVQVLLGDEIYKRRHGGRRGKFAGL